MIAQHRVSPGGDWETIVRAPHPALAPYVHRGYVGYVEATARPLRRLELPHAAITVIISLGPAIEVVGWGRRRSFVAGLIDAATTTEHAGDQLGIQLDLLPLGASMVFGRPMGELTRQVVDLEDLVPAALVARLAALDDWDARFDLLDAWLLSRIAGAAPGRPDVAWVWQRLCATHGAITVTELCGELRCSRRHLTARFGSEVGLPPKALARVLRFRRALALLAAPSGAGRFAEIAASAGYCDQPHLNRDFRALAGCSPTEYLARVMPEGRGVAG